MTVTGSAFRFDRRTWMMVGTAVVLLFLPMLFFPFGHDQSLFFLGGRMILDGGIHYRDIVDIKPPLIYHLYALAIFLFGPEAYAVRILDLILQTATSYLLCATIRRASGNDLWGAMAALLYPVLYLGLSYGSIAQCESYTGLLGIGTLYLLLFRRNTGGFILAGVLVGLLFVLKFTLGIFLAVVLLGELVVFRQKLLRIASNLVLVTLGFLIPLALTVLYLAAFDALDDFGLMQQFTSGYTSVQWQSIRTVAMRAIDETPQYLVINYSMLLFGLTLVGGVASLATTADDRRDLRQGDNSRLLRLCTISFLLLLVSIVIEAKYAPYRFGRIYPFGIVLATYGLLLSIRWLLRQRLEDAYKWIVIPTTVLLILFFSPLTRYLHHSGAALAFAGKGERGIDSYYGSAKEMSSRGEMLDVGSYWLSHRDSESEQLYIFSAFAPLFYQLHDLVPRHKVFHMAFVLAPFAPPEWRESTARHIITTRPAWIALQTNDSIPDLIDRSTTSAEGIMELPGVAPVLQAEYRKVLETDHFVLLHREGQSSEE